MIPFFQQCITDIESIPILKTTLQAIIQVESKGNPLALGLNKGKRLQFQPQSNSVAQKWVKYLEQNNYDFDVGLAQVNVKNAHKYGYTATDLLEPCTNLVVGSNILLNNYTNALSQSKSSSEALQKAISAYNTGNFHDGFKNGYVNLVYNAINQSASDKSNNLDIPPIVNTKQNTHNITTAAKQSTPYHKAPDSLSANPYNSKSLLYIQPRTLSLDELNSVDSK